MQLYKFRVTEISKGEVAVCADNFEKAEAEARRLYLKLVVELDTDEDTDVTFDVMDEAEID